MENRRLLVISHHYLTYLRDQVSIISKNFAKIDVLVRLNWYYNIIKKNRMLDLSDKPYNVNVTTIPIFYAPTDSSYKNLGEKHFKAVEKALKNNNYEFGLIHSHFTWSAGYVGGKLKEKYGTPFIATAHGYDIYDLPFRDNEWKEKIEYVLNTADYIITVSNSNLECIKKLGIKSPVKVIPNGFISGSFYPRDVKECRKTLNLLPGKKIILTVGNLVEIKGHQHLIKAVSEIVKNRKDILCIIIGSGELKNKLEKQIKKAGLENYILLAGGRPHDEIPVWMNACDVFVLPSLNEGNPTVMFECLGCGKPFVGTKVGGVPEIIISEEYGLLVEPADSEDLAEKILIALDKEWNYEMISKYAEQFTWENLAREILTVYQHVI